MCRCVASVVQTVTIAPALPAFREVTTAVSTQQCRSREADPYNTAAAGTCPGNSSEGKPLQLLYATVVRRHAAAQDDAHKKRRPKAAFREASVTAKCPQIRCCSKWSYSSGYALRFVCAYETGGPDVSRNR